MRILSGEEIRALDRYTIQHEPISELNLMERAACSFQEFVMRHSQGRDVHIFCGEGNNGGDGLAIARLLHHELIKVRVYLIHTTSSRSSSYTANLKRLGKRLVFKIHTKADLPVIQTGDIIVDAILGSGLSRPARGIVAETIRHINRSGAKILSVDVPSGLFIDKSNSPDDAIVCADVTGTFHALKRSFLFPENEKYVPHFEVLDIGLHAGYVPLLPPKHIFLDKNDVCSLLRVRKKFSHKGDYGHVLIAAGADGKAGAALLCVGAALRSGAGLVTALVPDVVNTPLLSQHAEAMTISAGKSLLERLPSLDAYTTIAVGPGMGTSTAAKKFLSTLLRKCQKPMVLDADAINILSQSPELLKHLPAGSVLTPHPGEFRRLCGAWKNDSDKLNKQLDFSSRHGVVVVLKGAYTTVASPGGQLYFNSTGNPGMAKGGSGDVLTGIIAALLAQQYTGEEAAVLGVYVHGLAGDFARDRFGEMAMKAGDLLNTLPDAFKQLYVAADSSAKGSFC